jgi:hypothetical protein
MFGGSKMIIKVLFTILILLSFGYLNYFIDIVDPIVANKVAIQQFKPSDISYVVSQYGIHLTQFVKNLLSIVSLLIIVLLWWKPAKKLFLSLIGIMLLIIIPSISCYAYYDKQDWPEPIFILPNESAFFVPDVGDNKDGQSRLETEQYLRENKIATKRFLIPHRKLSGSGWLNDYYVSTGRLIIVDRTPYNREWTQSNDRGTEKHDQSFPCQTKEGLNVAAEIAIATSVTEDDSPKFLYKYGVKPPKGDRTKPEVIFTSVYYGRSLVEVMDSVGRGYIQSLIGEELSSRDLDHANSDMPAMMASIRLKAQKYFKDNGITLDYIGWAGTLSFDKDIQRAINDAWAAKRLAPSFDIIQKRMVLETINKWDGKVPTTMLMLGGKLTESLNDLGIIGDKPKK